jgi:hypothetical protein
MKPIYRINWYVVAAFVFGALVGAGAFTLYALPAQASAGDGVAAPNGAGYVLSAGTNQAWILRTDGVVYVCDQGTSASKGGSANAGGCRRVGSL